MWLLSFLFEIIYSLLGFVSSLITPICAILLAIYIWHAHKTKIPFSRWADEISSISEKHIGSFRKPLLIISILGILITNAAVHQIVGIHNLKLLPEGSYCFYVEAHQQGGNTYVLPASVEVVRERIDRDEGRSKTRSYYYIKSILFSNGGWLDADDGEADRIGKPSDFWDGEYDWELTLLNEHAYSPRIQETNNADWLDILFLLIELIPASSFLLITCRKKHPQKNDEPPPPVKEPKPTHEEFDEDEEYLLEAYNGQLV